MCLVLPTLIECKALPNDEGIQRYSRRGPYPETFSFGTSLYKSSSAMEIGAVGEMQTV